MARPTTYSLEMLQKAKDYLFKLPEDEVVHSIEGLSEYVGVSRATIYSWKSQELDDDRAEFLDIVDAVLAKQSKTLVNKGLTGDFTPAITKVMLSKHGYSEKIETDITTKGESLNTDTEAEKAAAIAYAEALKPKE